ncbi:hypothetical protein VNI00_006337 [Paramarasmius palmivorus]|uniref:HNH nuclease domain-containing protein n=1 Tax=Paramarasmius palmivorus TaxID=297713 RepID=A0AAW0DB51_9AGAR
MSEPLPDPDITLTSCSPHVREAYSRVFRAQKLAEKAQKPAEKAKEQRNARIVGYLLIYLHQFEHTLDETPITYLEEEIRRLENDEKVFELGEHYLQLFAAFRRHKPTPYPSTHPLRPSFDNQKAELLESLVGSKRDHARAKHLALFRDGFLCLATSHLETEGVLKHGISRDGRSACPTQCCHIFGAGNVTDCQENGPKRQRASGMLSILKAFGISMSDTLLQENGVHDLRNILTLQTLCHEEFDGNMCFEPQK